MSNIKNILVVGAGIAGPSVCYWLKKYGFSPTLIENAAEIRKGGQALDVRGVATDLVKKMGIYNEIADKRTRIECGRFVDKDGHTLHEEFGEKVGFRQGDEVELIRGDLVEILIRLIPDVPCHFNRSIATIAQHDAGVTVTFKDGSTQEFDLVIGADGIHSATRRAVFAKDEYQMVNLGAYISIYSIPNYLDINQTEVICEANQKMATITNYGEPDISSVGLMFRSRHVLNNVRDISEQMQFLRDTFQDFGWELPRMLDYMPESHDFYFDSIAQVKMPVWSKGRVVLVGDAGYCATPLSGQGNNLAMIGAYILAGELKNANGDYQAAFERYHELMQPFVAVNQDFSTWVSQSFLVDSEMSKEIAADRTEDIMQRIGKISTAITLPDYG